MRMRENKGKDEGYDESQSSGFEFFQRSVPEKCEWSAVQSQSSPSKKEKKTRLDWTLKHQFWWTSGGVEWW